ncbi:MAG TPA: hypothetical protein VM286_09675 [Candidatus Thermoplasmatota archaeon]|nr:hypothetical protein [Candidatus Thermoplasmatota archaeon]
MKVFLALLAALLMVPLAGPVAAQGAPADAMRMLEDNPNDTKMSSGQDPPSGRWAAADLRAVDVLEAADGFTFYLKVGDLKASPELPQVESTAYTVDFLHAGRHFRLEFFRQVSPDPFYNGYVAVYDPSSDYFDTIASRSVRADLATGTLVMEVERDLLVDADGNAPHPGVSFTGWNARSQGGFRLFGGSPCLPPNVCTGDADLSAHDAMPDQGNGTAALPVQFGIQQSGKARLYSDLPTRASNGEATTIVYQVAGLNLSPHNATYTLAVSGVPPGWQVKLPAERVEIPTNGSVRFPILLTVPFTHSHGSYQKFLLELSDMDDKASIGRIELGIRYSDPPQPAGHHNVLYLHSSLFSTDALAASTPFFGGAPSGLSMNARPDDPNDAKADVQADRSGQQLSPPTVQYSWTVPLSPALELGLDVRQGSGNLSVPFKTTVPLPGAQLGGHVTYLERAPDPDTGRMRTRSIVIADIHGGAPVDMGARSEKNVLTAQIVARPEAGYFAFTRGSGMYMELQLTAQSANGAGTFTDAQGPMVQPGGVLDLPLNEYHDKVAQVFSSNNTLVLKALSAQDRLTNPEKMVLFNLTLANHGNRTMDVDLEITGTHLLWVSLLEPTTQRITLAKGANRTLQVAVKVPKEADKGDTADLVLSATSTTDLGIRALARLRATVDTSREYRDDAALIAAIEGKNAKKKTPAPDPALLALALLGLALATRRRGRRLL